MIPILYAASETDFATNGIGLLTDAVSCTVTEERNGAYEATLVYPAKGHLAEYIAEDAIIKAKANDTDEPQLFRIYKSGKQIGSNTTWNAEHISYELTGNPVERFSASGVNAEQALNRLLAAAVFKHKYTATSDITTVNSTSIADVVSVRKALGGVKGSILDTWGGEYHFNNYRIELLKARGTDNGVTIEYGKNLTDAKQERNIANIVTAIFPYAKYTPEGEENEVYISLKEKTLVHAGAADYAYKRCEIVDFSSEWESGTIITEDMLRAKAEAYLEKISTEPDINITLSYAQLKKTKDYKNIQAMESVALCDTVTVRIDKLQIEATAKIVKAKYDSLKERYDTVEIGSVRTNLTKQLTATQQEVTESIKKNQMRAEQIKKQIEQTIVDVTAAITGNSGGYVVLYPEKNPQEIMILDTPNVNTAKNVWRWNLAGLGHSSTGVNGTFTTAITADGKIVADFIATGELNGLLIKAGTIEADAISIGYKNLVTKEINEKGELITADYTTKFETTADSITAEVTRATTAEGDLSSSIKSTADNITAEVKRAQDAEKELKASIKVNADNITSCVTKDNVGSYITQYYNNVIVAFNNSSKYVQLKAGEINIYNGEVDAEHLRSRFDEVGNRFWRDNYYVGCIGTNQWSGNNEHKGLVFDLEYQGKYMAWARQAEAASGSYTTVLCYSRANSIYTDEGLHLGAKLYAHGFEINGANHKNSSANGYTVADNKRVSIVTEIHNNGDGTIGWTTSSITVRDGAITGVPEGSSSI